MLFLCIAFSIIVPYLICSINPAIIVTKLKSGEDIRKLGSGSGGVTNVLRTQGKTAAVIVLFSDIFKGVISILLVRYFTLFFFPEYELNYFSDYSRDWLIPFENSRNVTLCLWIGSLAAVLGHCFPLYYRFKGGKAVLVTVTTGMVIGWLAPLIALSIFIAIVALTRYVSLGSVIAAVCYPVCVWLIGTFVWVSPHAYIGVIFTSVIAVILVFMHRQNIIRLLNKTEKKLGQSERKKNG